MGNDLDEFLAHLDELSSDSISLDQQLIKEKEKNQRMNKILVALQSSTKDILSIYKNERLITVELQEKLNQKTQTCNSLERQYDELKSIYDNNTLLNKQSMEELKLNQAQERQDYIDLAKDYFDLLSDTTCFYNYEIKKSQNKIISKSEKLLYNFDKAWERPKLIRSKRSLDNDGDEARSRISRVSSRKSKRGANKSNESSELKRRKTEIWDMKSISQATSPASGIPFDFEETSDLSSELCGAESSFSFNTFSIGNETSFTSLQSPPSFAPDVTKCRCHLFPDQESNLVSIGTNTDPPDSIFPSVPSLLDDDGLIEAPLTSESKEAEQHFESSNESNHEVSSTSEATQTEELPEKLKLLENSSALPVSNTQSDPAPTVAQTRDQTTSTEPPATYEKSTSTIHSTTTRGTSTISVVRKNFAVQFPELSMESIFNETIFDLPDCLLPILESEDVVMSESQTSQCETKSTDTMTEICNVNREIGYIVSTPMIVKPESSPIEHLLNSDDNSFIILGQTLFDLFLKRMQKSNQMLSDDDITRRKIWKYIKRQLVDRFSELSFDDSLNSSFSDSEMNPVDKISSNECQKAMEPETDQIGDDSNTEEATKPTLVDSAPLIEITLIENSHEETIVDAEVVEVRPEVTEELPDQDKGSSDIEADSNSDSQASEPMSDDFEEIFTTLKTICLAPPDLLEPIEDLSDIIWDSLFPENQTESQSTDDCPEEFREVLKGFDVDHEPIEIPTEAGVDLESEAVFKATEQTFAEFESPRSPPPFVNESEMSSETAVVIPTEPLFRRGKVAENFDSVLDFDPKLKSRIIHWQEINKVNSKDADRQLCKARSSIKSYLESDWTDKNLEKCCKIIGSIGSLFVIREAIIETVQDNKSQKEISIEFTPPAPPLPPYQQKLILLVQKLSEIHLDLPDKLVEDIEEKIFRLDNTEIDSDDLRNVGYFYSALIDLFFEGDSATVFYFIVKCIYFYGCKSVPIIFVLLKAFPEALPRKLELLKKNSKDVDWENMSAIELSKVFFDLECMDSLDLTVVFMITQFQEDQRLSTKNKKKKKRKRVEEPEHELFRFFSRYYGFASNFILRPRLLQVLMKRLEEGNLLNLSISFILLAKRSTFTYSHGTIVKGNLIPMLEKNFTAVLLSQDKADVIELEPMNSKLCLVIEAVSSIVKTFTQEKEKSVREVFTKFVGILNQVKNREIQESCLQAILRLQRLCDNQKEIYEMIKSFDESSGERMNDSLRFAIKTFIHRKCEKYIKNEN